MVLLRTLASVETITQGGPTDSLLSQDLPFRGHE